MWTTAYGEDYDYESIMHYSARAFVKDRKSKSSITKCSLNFEVY